VSAADRASGAPPPQSSHVASVAVGAPQRSHSGTVESTVLRHHPARPAGTDVLIGQDSGRSVPTLRIVWIIARAVGLRPSELVALVESDTDFDVTLE